MAPKWGSTMDIRRALIVDDSKLVCYQFSELLKKHGVTPEVVHSGEEALEFLAKHPAPDIVFLDINMKGMNGYQTLDTVRAQPTFAKLPIFMCSSDDSEEDQAKASEKGATGFVPKPPTSEGILKVFADLSKPSVRGSSSGVSSEEVVRVARETVETLLEAKIKALRAEIQAIESNVHQVVSSVVQEVVPVFIQPAVDNAIRKSSEDAKQAAAQAAAEAVRTQVPERLRALAATTLPALATPILQESAAKIVQAIVQQQATSAVAAALQSALPTALVEVASRAKQDAQASLAREASDKVGHAITDFLKSEDFRVSMAQAVHSAAENVAKQVARQASEKTAQETVEKILSKNTSPAEELAREALEKAESAGSKSMRVALAVGAGLVGVIVYLAVRVFV
ncbi:hypothetical protein CCP3SC1AL1_130031 [Gammaproteobacteria bacterium]